jgi:DNA-binding response OmpR family regulator
MTTKAEQSILSLLQQTPGEVVSRAALSDWVYGLSLTPPPKSNSCEVLISRLRKAGHKIRSVRGKGYYLVVEQG